MASLFPTALPNSKTDYDNNDPVASADQNSQGFDINAIAAKVGIDGSADTNSLDYKINNVATPVKNTGAEINTGTEDTKFSTAKSIADSNIAFIADIPVKATGAESNTGTNDAKFVTPLAYKTAKVTVTAYAPVGAGTTTIDLSLGDVFRVTMPAATQTLALSNETVGQSFTLEIVNNNSQGALTWFTTITWAHGGSAPQLSGVTSQVDVFKFRVVSAGQYVCYDDDTTVRKDVTQTLTNKTLTLPVFTGGIINFNAPEGFLLNGKIVPTVSSNNLNVAIKGLDGNDPSATNPVYVRLGGVVRTLTSSLAGGWNAGTNWLAAGSAEMATKEIDFFVYLIWEASASLIRIGISRLPFATSMGDLSSTQTVSNGLISSVGSVVATDAVVNIGRFAATLSAGAGYTWTVPTFTAANLIQRPIYNTRVLSYQPAYGAGGSMTYGTVTTQVAQYVVNANKISIWTSAFGTTGGSASTSITFTVPFTPATATAFQGAGSGYDGGEKMTSFQVSSNVVSVYKSDFSNWGIGADKYIRVAAGQSFTV